MGLVVFACVQFRFPGNRVVFVTVRRIHITWFNTNKPGPLAPYFCRPMRNTNTIRQHEYLRFYLNPYLAPGHWRKKRQQTGKSC